MDEAEIERSCAFSHHGGAAAALESAAARLRRTAGEAYALGGDDEKARIYRAIADNLESEAKHERKKQKEFA